MKNELTALRLLEAMSDNSITQRELSERAKIKEASISQYVNGSHAPSNISAGKIADVLGVNPAWLMGFDVPKYPQDNRIELSRLTHDNYLRLKSYYEYLISEQKNEHR